MSEIAGLSFSSDATHFAICFGNSFQIYSTKQIQCEYQKEFPQYKLDKIATSIDGAYVAFVAKSDDNHSTVFLWNNSYGDCLGKYDFTKPIASLFLLPHLIFIIFNDSFSIFNIANKTQEMEQNTFLNPNGAADFSISQNNLLLGVCGNESGSIQIIDYNSTNRISFSAAKHPITSLKFSPNGSVIATASEKGTLIRTFDTTTGASLAIFRRGALTSSILSICFSPRNSDLIVISENGTVHLFAAADVKNTQKVDPIRSVAKIKIEKCKLAASIFSNDTTLLIVSSTGHLYTIRCGINQLELITKQFAFDAKY